ncbi:unnamed protein product [Malus baccata var. baccata]
MRVLSAVENACKPIFEKVEKWTEEKRKAGIEKELVLVEAELCLEEVIEDMDEELKRREKEEEKVEMGLQEEEDTSAALAKQDEKPLVEEDEDEEEEEDEDEDDVAPSSFGSATADQDATKNGQRGNNLVNLHFLRLHWHLLQVASSLEFHPGYNNHFRLGKRVEQCQTQLFPHAMTTLVASQLFQSVSLRWLVQ